MPPGTTSPPVVSNNRENTTSTNANNAATAPPKTAGPDDDYRISFPQTDATWSDLAFLNGTLYASLGTALGVNPYNSQIADNSNGVYRIANYATASGISGNSNAPVWDVGSGGVDTESSARNSPPPRFKPYPFSTTSTRPSALFFKRTPANMNPRDL